MQKSEAAQPEGYIGEQAANVALLQYGADQPLSWLNSVMEHSSFFMSFLDLDFNYLLVNRNLADIAAASREQMVGLSPFRNRPALAALVVPILQKVVETSQPFVLKEITVPREALASVDTPEGFLNMSYTPVAAPDGKVLGILSIVEDVTQQVLQRRRLEQLAEQEKAQAARLNAILSSLTEGLIVVNNAGQVALFNKVAEELAGRPLHSEYAEQVLKNRRRLDGTPLPGSETAGLRALHGEVCHNLRYLAQDINGQEKVISASAAPIYEVDSQIAGAVVLFRDVSDQEQQRRELEEAYRTTEATQKALLELATEAAGVTNLEQLLNRFVAVVPRITNCNRASISLYDASTELLKALAFYGFEPAVLARLPLPPLQRDRLASYDAALFEQHQPQVLDFGAMQAEAHQHGKKLYGPAGMKKMLLLPLAHQGRFIGLLIVDRINESYNFSSSEIRVLEGMARLAAIAIVNVGLLAEANQATTLREANRLKDEFLSLVAHELRNPLTAVQGYTQMTRRRLQKAGIPEADLKPLETIIAQAHRMTRLVEDLLDLSRIETGRLELRLAQCNLSQLIERTLETYAADTTNHTLTLELDDSPGSVRYVGSYDADRIDQVLSNLVSNALKYSPEGGEIVVRLKKQTLAAASGPGDECGQSQPVLHFLVSDPGIGIPVAQQAALFERFYRANNSRDSGLPGLGLGLYISSQIIVLHGGRMWAESGGEGQGSTFHFVLPAPLLEEKG